MEDVGPFLTWLSSQGLGEHQLAGYRKYLGELGKHPSLSAALKAAEEAGMPAREIANMRAVAARFAEFQATGSAGAPAPAADRSARPPTRPPPSAAFDVEKPAPRVPARDHSIEMPRKGCVCTRRHDVFLDNDFGLLAKFLAGGAGIGAIFLTRLIGIVGTLAIALGLAGLGGLATVISICLRCEGCRRRVTDLNAEERVGVRKGRALVALVTAAMLAGSGLCGFLWWKAAQARYHEKFDGVNTDYGH